MKPSVTNLGIRRGRVVSVVDFEPGVPGSIPSRGGHWAMRISSLY